MTVWHWLVHFMGVDQGLRYGTWNWYSFQSGTGSVFLGAILNGTAVFFLFYIHHTCHDSWHCLRWGRYPAAGGLFRYCHRHHPSLGKRPDRETRSRLHREWQQRTTAV